MHSYTLLGTIFFLLEQSWHGVDCSLSKSPLESLSRAQTDQTEEPDLIIQRNTRFVSADPFVMTSFPDMSLEQCMKECSKRAGCTAVEYRNLAKYCSLHTVVSNTEIATGFLTVSGFVGNGLCGNATCDPNRACDISTNNCTVKECRYPNIDGSVKGNRYQVGSLIVVHNTKQFKCAENAAWTYVGELLFVYQGITCRDIRQRYPSVETGVLVNQLNIAVYCDYEIGGGNWMVFHNRKDGTVNFTRNWQDYKTGFGDLNGEFWLGLENIHTILRESPSTQFKLRVDLEDTDGNMAYAVYNKFNLSDESDKYRLTCVDYTGTAGDALYEGIYNQHNGMKFSTFDNDNDNTQGNCAAVFRGGWWYNRCYTAYLNGVYNNSTYLGRIWLYSIKPNRRRASMKFKEITGE